MPWPKLNTYGITDNPILISPYVENNENDGGSFAENDFLLLGSDGLFLLLGGGNLLLLGAT